MSARTRLGAAALWIAVAGCASLRMTIHGKGPPTSCATAAVVDTTSYDVSKVDEPPRFRQGPAPRMPAPYRDSNASGRVAFLFTIQPNGVVDRSSITVHAAPDPVFIPAAMDALLGAVYWPACLNGHPVRVGPIQQTIVFSNS